MDIYQSLEQYGKIERNVLCKNMTTFRVGGEVDCVIYPNDTISLDQIIQIVNKNNIPFKIFGKGSNLLCSDDPFHGLVIRLDKTFDDCYFEQDTCIAQAGCSIISVCYEAMKKGLSGLEFASGIPGTIGGAIFMNAGAYKRSMSDVVKEVFVYRDGNCIWMKNSELAFQYRSSIFKNNPEWIILAVKLQLEEKPQAEIRNIMDERRERRLKTQPLDYPNAGSMFRNIDDQFAWKYIEEAGLRGKRIGGAQVSEKHANFILNVDHAKAKDILELVNSIQTEVKEQFDVDLVMEVEKFNW